LKDEDVSDSTEVPVSFAVVPLRDEGVVVVEEVSGVLLLQAVRGNVAISANMLNFKILFMVFLFGRKLEEAGIITFA
jgi:hypothetical protein